MTDGPGRGADSDGPGRNGAGDDGVGTDDTAVADHGAGEDGDAVAEPDVVADDDRRCGDERALGGRNGGVAARDCRWAAVAAVGVVCDEDAAAAEQVIADRDAIEAGDVHVVREAGGAADADLGVKSHGVSGFGVAGDGFEPEEVAGMEVRPQMQGRDPEEARGARGAEAGRAELPGPEPVAEPAAEGEEGVVRQVEPAVSRCRVSEPGIDGLTSERVLPSALHAALRVEGFGGCRCGAEGIRAGTPSPPPSFG